jgi:hypothetical protein
MLQIELITNVKLEHKIDFKLFLLSKTACANTNLLEQCSISEISSVQTYDFCTLY